MPSPALRITGAAITALRPLADGVISILLAPACAACRRPLATPCLGIVCADCWDAIRPIAPPFCPVCGDPLLSWRTSAERCADCRLKRSHISAGRTVGIYDGPLRSILQAFKYDRRRSLAAPLGRLMQLRGAAVLADADCVVPVPLHWRRRWRRGFNQALDLARQPRPAGSLRAAARQEHAHADRPACRRPPSQRPRCIRGDSAGCNFRPSHRAGGRRQHDGGNIGGMCPGAGCGRGD